MKTMLLFCLLTSLLFTQKCYVNALIDETSPYLQQHAHNPIAWYPWGEEALEKAKKEHKLIFLSIGYSTCHWCHVMEEESFIDEKVAKLLNAHYISIKVDREEYPQLDKKYQKRFLAQYGKRGGWPLTLILSSEGEVLYIATYIPKEEGYGSEGLLHLLAKFVKLQQNPSRLQRYSTMYEREGIKKVTIAQSSAPFSEQTLLRKIMQDIVTSYDPLNGGFSSRPKYPEASKIEMLLTLYRLYGDKASLGMAQHTLDNMARGGIYDQVEGGFFRYTTDEAWQQPHFEKMLYTNAALIPPYVELFLMTKAPLYKRIVEETISQVAHHFSKNGLFFSASDADSHGEEGGYYLYTYEKVYRVLLKRGWSSQEAEKSLSYFGIEEDGNVDGELSHLHITARYPPKGAEALRHYLKSLRERRVFPFVDKKVITAWNAMMVKALFRAGKIAPCYTERAKIHLKALVAMMYRQGVLYHQTLLGTPPRQQAILEDYAFLIDALIEGYARTYDPYFLHFATTLTREAVVKFYRKKVWYLSHDGIKVMADFDDRYYRSPLSVMLENLLRLGTLLEEHSFMMIAKETILSHRAILYRYPADVPKFVEIYLRFIKGTVVIHAKKEMLSHASEEINRASYPFFLGKVAKNKGYLACGMGCCFTQKSHLSELIQTIEILKSSPKNLIWRQ